MLVRDSFFLVCGYFKLPVQSDWNTISALAPFFACTDGASGYTTPEADLLTIAQQIAGGNPRLLARRQTNGGTGVDDMVVDPSAAAFGKFAQISYWRNATGRRLRLRTSATDQFSIAGAVGVNNSGDFSQKRARWGVPESFNNLASAEAHRAASNTRLYRGFIEDLSTSERDPVAVLDADWTRTIARGVFS